ncbi:hypothetical protein CEXT_456691 [Caerostris extrusa]|uniref:Uncharacterized protein n=1 Tax=Caerostris extrusa TaxID=172846 RepID=A0AAV4Y9V0_CAEEX|nr:hypothetical protein CEXT_456691 [Caerostris extrusa]
MRNYKSTFPPDIPTFRQIYAPGFPPFSTTTRHSSQITLSHRNETAFQYRFGCALCVDAKNAAVGNAVHQNSWGTKLLWWMVGKVNAITSCFIEYTTDTPCPEEASGDIQMQNFCNRAFRGI